MNSSPAARLRAGSVLALVLAVLFTAHSGAAHAASGSVGPSILGLNWSTAPEAPCDAQNVQLLFRVCECTVELLAVSRDSLGGPIQVSLRVHPNTVCVRCIPDTMGVDLGLLAAGTHSFTVGIDIEYTSPPGPEWPPSPVDDRVEFFVSPVCGPSPTGVPYLDQVVIEDGAPCPTCPARVCPEDSVDVRLRGTFPNACLHFLGVSLIPDPTLELTRPPIVRLSYGDHSICAFCGPGPVPWEAHVRLPAQPYLGGAVVPLPVEAERLNLCSPDSIATLIGRDTFPFVVAESCSIPPGRPCANVAWMGPGTTRCLDTYSWTKSAQVALGIGSTVPISGVQGWLTLDQRNVLIMTIEAARPGWQLIWSRPADGQVRFVAFAGPDGTPIPGDPSGRPDSLLRVWVASGPTDIPARTALTVRDLVVSDPGGHGVPPCPDLLPVYPPSNTALLCHASACDANGDGHSDVRDLVLMLNCLDPPPNVRLACPDPAGGTLDCDADGGFDLDDVFCCARAILNGGEIPPPDTTLREAPEIAVRFGLPRESEDGLIEVPLHFEGMAEVAAARLDVVYPDDRYEVVSAAFESAPASWWTVAEIAAGRIGLAILDLSGLDAAGRAGGAAVEAGPGTGSALLVLRLRSGRTAGGELSVSGHDFAAGDGVTLRTPNAEARLALAATGHVALSVPRPNPFAATTSFALTLPATGSIDVAVFNVAGRRVATLMREARAGAGVYALRWDGTEEGGGRAAGGVYFVRVVTDLGRTSRKLLFLPGGER